MLEDQLANYEKIRLIAELFKRHGTEWWVEYEGSGNKLGESKPLLKEKDGFKCVGCEES